MPWNDKSYTDIVAKHPELDTKPESVALAVWALEQNKDMTPKDWQALSAKTGVKVLGRAVGSARALLGMAPKSGGGAGRTQGNRSPAAAGRDRPARASDGALDGLLGSIRAVQQERDAAYRLLRRFRDEIDQLV